MSRSAAPGLAHRFVAHAPRRAHAASTWLETPPHRTNADVASGTVLALGTARPVDAIINAQLPPVQRQVPETSASTGINYVELLSKKEGGDV